MTVTQPKPNPNPNPNPTPALAEVLKRARVAQDLESAAALLSWDRQTMMPPAAHEGRAQQLAALAAVVHEKLTDPGFADAVNALAAEQPTEGSDAAAVVRLVRRSIRLATAVPKELVRESALATSRAQQVWQRAREEGDGAAFLGPLGEVLRLKREEADAIGWQGHRYDALHDRFEPGSTKARLDEVFAPLRSRLPELLAQVREQGRPVDATVLQAEIEPREQEAFVRELVADLGYDFGAGRLDPTVHPFCETVGPGDVRITTRYARNFLPTALFGTVHEAGHALYEQGIRTTDLRTPIGTAASMAVHESQSRLWENQVGRSVAFWEGRYPGLQRAFPGAFGAVSLDRFLAAVNRIEPSLIRVEADEVGYPLHVLLRYDLEVALVEGSLSTRELRSAWNEGMQRLLGIVPADDASGFLQDVHWSMGAFGYFPSYALGTMMSAQLWTAAQRALGDLDGQLRAGRYIELLGWLRRNVHEVGARLEPDELTVRATGAPLGAGPYLEHLAARVDAATTGAS